MDAETNEREALARVLARADAFPPNSPNPHIPPWSDYLDPADAILASDWLKAHTAAVVEAERAACEAAIDKLMAQSHKVMRETSTGDELHKAACIEALAFSCARAVVAARKAPE